MDPFFLDCVNYFFENQNIGANEYTVNLKSREEYNTLFAPVYKLYLIGKKQGLNNTNYYDKLYCLSDIKQKIGTFILEQGRAPGLVMSYGTANHKDILVCGSQQELDDDGNINIIPIKRNSIFDMASVTKIFTCLMILKLVDFDMLQLSNNIFELDNRFINLKKITVNDLLSFKVPLITAGRIEDVQSLEEAERLIFEIKPNLMSGRLYSDMGAIVLKYVIERLTGRIFFDLVKENILDPCGMQDTIIKINSENLGRTVSNNFERRIYHSEYITMDYIEKGIISDGKARNINKFGRQLHGHAGMFTTVEDMAKFSQALMHEKIVDSHWLNVIGRNMTGQKIGDGIFSQFHGFLSYSKNPIERESEVNHFLSGNAFALGGYTGNQLTVDSTNCVFVFMASNRCHNRVTQIIDGSSNVVNENGYVTWKDGHNYMYNKGYAYDRDAYVIAPAVELALQYRFIEYLLENDNKMIECSEAERNLSRTTD